MSKYKPIKINLKKVKIRNPYYAQLSSRQARGGGVHTSKKAEIEAKQEKKDILGIINEQTDQKYEQTQLFEIFDEINAWWKKSDVNENVRIIDEIIKSKPELFVKAEAIKNILLKEQLSADRETRKTIKNWLCKIENLIKKT